MTRILYLVTEDWYFCSHRLPLARAAKQAGYEIIVVTQAGNHADIIRNEGFKFISVIFPRSMKRPWQDIRTLYSIFKIYRQEHPDVVHHVALKPVLYGSLIAIFTMRKSSCLIINALTGLGFVFTSTRESVGLLRSLVKFFLRFILRSNNSYLILQNSDDAQMLIENNIVDRARVSIIRGSGVDIQVFKPNPQTGNELIIMLIARMLKDKGVEEFVIAASQLKSQGINARFVLVGGADQENPSAIPVKKLNQWDSEGSIEWWGKRDDMVEVYKQANIVVLPSYREGLPKVLLEAAACGLPIVTTDVPGCREIVINEKNGLLVPAKNAQALAKAINRLINSPELCKQMGEKGREMVEKEFSLDKVVGETLDLYKYLLDKQHFQ